MITTYQKVQFFTGTKVGKTLWAVINFAALMIGVFFSVAVLWFLDTRLAPVITDFRIEQLERHGGNYVLSGTFRKLKPCELLAVNVTMQPKDHDLPKMLMYQLKAETVFGGQAPTGHSTWGPLTLPIPVDMLARIDSLDYLEISALHRCHALWNQETVYTRFSAKELP